MSDIQEQAIRLGRSLGHPLAESLFNLLKRVHQLKPLWCSYLCAAEIMQQTGEAISSIHPARHSYYIVKNANFPGMQSWETEFIAQLCLLAPRGKLSKKTWRSRTANLKGKPFSNCSHS
jgi:exopolyphosphatase/pppGpp-phosphohydrolase